MTYIVYRFKTEEDLIIAFPCFTKTRKPHITTGWNIFNFDTTFLIKKRQNYIDVFQTFYYKDFQKTNLERKRS